MSPVIANSQVWQKKISNCHLLQAMMKHFLEVRFLSVNLKPHVQKFSTIIPFYKHDVISGNLFSLSVMICGLSPYMQHQFYAL